MYCLCSRVVQLPAVESVDLVLRLLCFTKQKPTFVFQDGVMFC
jgi:hypothetical protein